MLRSLFAGISGLRVNQTMLDVTGNNIANANTIGYKSSTTVFQDTLSQMLTAASSPSATRGGTNPMQVGLGVQVGAITTNFGQGSAQTTGRSTDLMIQGDGFFVVANGNEKLYTRAGAFTFDNNGTLVSPDGYKVQGYMADMKTGTFDLSDPTKTTGITLPKQWNDGTNPPSDLVSYNISSDGTIRGVFANGEQHDIAQLDIADFKNPMGLEKVGDTCYRASANSGGAEDGVSGTGRRGTLVGGALEMSNVDLAAEFTNLILAQRGFQASSRVITTSDQVLEDLVNIKR